MTPMNLCIVLSELGTDRHTVHRLLASRCIDFGIQAMAIGGSMADLAWCSIECLLILV